MKSRKKEYTVNVSEDVNVDSDTENNQENSRSYTKTTLDIVPDAYSRIQKKLINYAVDTGYPLCEFLTASNIEKLISQTQ